MIGRDLRMLAEACPNLQSLGLQGLMQSGCSPDVLLDLPSCLEFLQLGDAFGNDAADVVCQLTQLQHLSWFDSTTLTDAGLERLTALTRLTTLSVVGCEGLSEAMLDDWELSMLELHNTEVRRIFESRNMLGGHGRNIMFTLCLHVCALSCLRQAQPTLLPLLSCNLRCTAAAWLGAGQPCVAAAARSM
jgi:hypothetical protein